MKILLPYFSRSGHTRRLAETLAAELRQRGHQVDLDEIQAVTRWNKWLMAAPLLPVFPVLPLYLWVAPFRRWWLKIYNQQEQAIQPVRHADTAGYDLVCLGGPKWLYVAYPVARYLKEVRGLAGKPVGAFATFCGPPLKAFELEMLFEPLQARIRDAGGRPIATLAISSHHHEFGFMVGIFRLVSRLGFGRALRTFGQDSDWGRQEIQRFCDELEATRA